MKLSKKYLCCFLAAMMFCIIVSGGCGGGSSSGGSSNSSGNNQTNNETPNTPTNPNTPVNTDDEYGAETISGSWVASNGTGTATGPDGTFDLSMISTRATFGQIQTTNNAMTTYVSASATWDAYQNGAFIRSIPLEYQNELVEIQKTGKNTWRYTFPSSVSKITAKLTSETTASVTEEGNFGLGSYVYQYVATYTIRKQ